MGKTFRKDSRHNKFNRRDRDARKKFSEKFHNPKRPAPIKPTEPSPNVVPVDEEY